MQLNLKRPLVFFDLETTGTSITRDRIVEISCVKVYPDGHDEEFTQRVNPCMHIPEASTAVHHITDEDVKDAPTFRDIAPHLREIFRDADIAGYNSNKFDVPLLIEEFGRVGMTFKSAMHKFVDVQNIFHKMEQRTLVAAYKFYCGKDLDNAHSAVADTRATYEVLLSQLERYPELQNDVEHLDDFSRSGKGEDLSGRVVLNEKGLYVFNFGKHKGRTVEEVFKTERSFYSWVMQGDFPKTTKDLLTSIYFRLFPPKPRPEAGPEDNKPKETPASND